jgi:hypothetical protein
MAAKKDLIKNPQVAEKEAELKKLQTKYKQVFTRLEKEKLKLEELKQNIVQTQRNAFSTFSAKLDQIRQLKAEILAAFEEVNKSKHIRRQEKKMFRQMAKELAGMDAENDMEFGRNQFADDEEQQRPPSEYFQEFAVKPEAQTGQNIRKVFLKLATRFHPDKARSPQEAEQMHQMMQRINEAYKRNDIAELLEIEKQYSLELTQPENGEVNVIDWLQEQINRIQQQITLLEDQLSRLKSEARKIQRSDVGKMHKQFSGKNNPMGEVTDDMDESIQNLTLLRDGLREYARTGQLPESLMEQIYPPEPQEMEFDLEDLAQILWEMQEQEEPQPRKGARSRKRK